MSDSSGSRATAFFRGQSLGLDSADGPRGAYVRFAKRGLDIVAACVFIAVFLPLIVILLLAATSDGARPLFGHRRVGLDGRPFRCWKIRTMVPDAEARLAALLASDLAARRQWETQRKLDRDPRITPLGHFLRRSSLDELPQLWNVLTGEMSIVGPRPVTRDELALYGDAATQYTALRPGLTGLWQTVGRGRVSYAERVHMDRTYHDTVSFLLDLKILLRTALVVCTRTGS